MTALSSGNLYQPLLVGSGQIQRLDDFIWPTYHRVTLEQGGDHYAEFMVSAEDHDVTAATLERWFMTWIGHHFEESYAGRVVFSGYVHTMRIYVGGVMRQITLEDMYNRVQVEYQTDSAASVTATGNSDDDDSIATYGTKSIRISTSPDYISAALATAIRDDFLARHAWPQTSSGDVVVTDSDVTLEVYIQGYTHTINWTRYSNATDSAVDLSTHIGSNLLASLDFVSASNIATISTSITTESEARGKLDRINALIGNLEYSWGCFAGRSFDIIARDLTTIKYRRQAYGDRYGFRQGGRYVPEPLITPGGWLFTEDIFAAYPLAADLRDDPRTDWISSVDYSIDGVTLTNPDWSVQGLALTLSGEIQETAKKERQMWIDRASLKPGG